MKVKLGLRFRVTVAHLVLGATLSVGLAVAVTFILEHMEARYVQATLLESLDLVVQAARHQERPELPQTETMKAYVFTDGEEVSIPGRFAGLGPGVYDEDSAGREVLVAIRDDGPRRYVLTYDESTLDRLESYVTIGLIFGVLAFTYAALWLGFWMSGRVLGPVTSLARQINALGDEVSAISLHGQWADDEVGDLARAFERYSQRLCEFIERERAFTADVSHELRNPIMSASSSLDLLLDEPTLAPSARQRLQRLRRAIDRMGEIVDVFLALGRESGTGSEPDLSDVQVESVARAVIERHFDSAQAKGVDIHLDTTVRPRVAGRASAVSIVLENVIGNAVRHTPSGQIEVKLYSNGVTVSDTGPGIPEEERSRVFERGFRGRHASAQGAGLGLSIVNRVCGHWGWRVSFEQAEPHGTIARLQFST